MPEPDPSVPSKKVRLVSSFAALERLDREEDWALTPQERFLLVEEMRRAHWGIDYDAEPKLSRSARIVSS